MEALTAYLTVFWEGLLWFLGEDFAPWLLLLFLLLVRPPALREIRLARKTGHTRQYRHLLNLTRFRTELAKRQELEHRPRIGHWR